MRRDFASWFLATTMIAVLSACARPSGTPPVAASQPSDGASAPDRVWDDLAAAARAEGKLVLATNNTAVREDMADAFTKRFGVEVEVVTGRGSDTVARIMRERAAGLSTVDVLISGLGTASSQLYPAHAMASIKSMLVVPEVTDPAKWRDGKLKFADPDGEYILRSVESIQNNIVINTDFVKRDEVRKSDDLLNPKFQGKIATHDPLQNGGGLVVATYLMKLKGEDYVRKLFVDQKAQSSNDDRQLADWMARGIYPINLNMTEEDVLDLMKEGMKLEAFSFDDLPPQTGAGGAFLIVIDPTPHPNAAKLWVNWFASKEGQEMAAIALGEPSNRLDVEANKKLPQFLVPQPGRDYFDINDWNFTADVESIKPRLQSLLGG
ncbi:MAG TPA: extracellular solute-binding protein [Chloroflexota bacterium]|nr:extracellular solute-binding protein [Chloroflexota bacterium]